MIRTPAVAGMFYEGSAEGLSQQVDRCVATNPTVEHRQSFRAAVVPHAGLMYSGHVAAAFYASVDLPQRFIILCPNHTGLGAPAAINAGGAWRTPLGEAKIDEPLARGLMQRTKLLQEDWRAHAKEHSLEVQLPFLQRLGHDFTFVPICLAAPSYAFCQEIGEAIADTLAASDDAVAVLASSDLNHYEDQQTTIRKDNLAIDAVLALDPEALWKVVEEADISMCGYIPTTTMLIAMKKRGAAKATLLKHATSGDINGDYSHVVGYASIAID